jgi:Fur family iron response transcriptional regulator
MHQNALLEQNNKRFVIRQLTQQGITPTQQRVEIGIVLLTKRQHLSADQVLDKVNAMGNIVSKATVYNTLSLFVNKGLAKEVNVDSSRILYDSNTAPHHHFYNVDTGTLYDIDAEQLELKEVPTPPEFASIKDVEIIVRVHQGQTNA